MVNMCVLNVQLVLVQCTSTVNISNQLYYKRLRMLCTDLHSLKLVYSANKAMEAFSNVVNSVNLLLILIVYLHNDLFQELIQKCCIYLFVMMSIH